MSVIGSTLSPLSADGVTALLPRNETMSMLEDNCYDHNLLTPLVSQILTFHAVQAVVYFGILIYLFLGIAIIADIFMCAIEAITSKSKTVKIKTGAGEEDYEEVEVKIWNETVANLTLMALGSSAPEILLSIIEIVGNNFTSGDLGPGTIVGSAAFNLLMITAVCMVSIPNHESRAIKGIRVFAVTSFFGLFAYIWIFLVLVVVSPNVVEVWEAFLTFFMFILLVVISYVVDRNFFKAKPARVKQSLELNDVTETDFGNAILGREADSNARYKSHFKGGKLTKKNLARFIKDVRRVDPSLSDEDAACLAATYIFENETHSRLFYRVSACRQMSGSKAPLPHLSQHLQDVYSLWKHSDPKQKAKKKVQEDGTGGDQVNGQQQQTTVDGNLISLAKTVAAEHAEDKNIAVVQFSAPTAIVMENAGKVEVSIRRYGKMDVSFKCMVETLDRTAKADVDYKAVKEEVTFAEHEREKIIDIEIIDDKNWNPDKVFLVKLSLDSETDERPDVAKGRMCLMTVTIVDDDEPGTISFTHRLYTVTETDGKAVLPLQREGGADGQILLRYKTVDGSAKNGRDFRGGDGIVIFMHGVTEANIEIPITNDLDEERDEYFEVVLVSVDNGAKLGKLKRAMVTVTNDDEYNSAMGKLLNKVRINRDNMRLHGEAWREQFLSAVKVKDEDEEEEGAEPRISAFDYILHCLSFFWKVLFAVIPPVGVWGGWCTFLTSLTGIGILTAIVGDVAGTFGCLIGLPKPVNAITFVAMGTSLPDLFASRTAARMETTADNAIGNVTGSNSVNVFLGLGLPWLVASIYWHTQGKPFVVPAGSLGFSVGIFTGVALVATGILLARRSLPVFGKGELGGPPAASWGCAILFICLWFIYCTLSSLQAYGVIAA